MPSAAAAAPADRSHGRDEVDGPDDDRGQERTRPASGPLIAATTSDNAATANAVVALVDLVDRLTQRIGVLEAEKAEAIALGHRLADERDRLAFELAGAIEGLQRSNANVRRLHETIDVVLGGIVEVSTSPLALPVRGRLRAILAV